MSKDDLCCRGGSCDKCRESRRPAITEDAWERNTRNGAWLRDYQERRAKEVARQQAK